MKKISFCICMVILLCSPILAQISNGASSNDGERASVALVLSGAGPRGFAHIPVIELFEELGIPIDFVLGTSSGAIVGGLYSAGYTGEELAQTVLDIDWPLLIQDQTHHLLTSALGTHSSTANLLNIKLDGDFSLNLGGGLLSGQYVYSKLKALTAKIPSYTDFDTLPIPYRATAVDLVTGDLVFLEEGDIAEAMRASMTLPGVFEPFPIDDRYYLDGFIRNTLPLKAVRELGYDIVIAVEISDKIPEDASLLNTDPMTVLSQVLALQQLAVTSQEYEYADLVLFPDLTEFGSADYAFSKEIYAKGKIEAEKFRDDLIALKAKIFPENADADSLSKKIATIDTDGTTYFRDEILYSDIPSLVIDEVRLHNAYPYDEKMILRESEKIKNRHIEANELETFLRKIYETSNYLMVTSRITSNNGITVLELDFFQKDFEAVRIGAMQTFEGSISNSASWELSNSVTIQLNDFLGLGGVLSLQSTFLSKSGLELMHLQPLTDKVFLRSIFNAFQLIDVETSGYKQAPIQASYFREGNLALGVGVFFSPEHKLLNEVGFHWIDSTRTLTELGEGVFDVNDLELSYALDGFTRYTFNNLNNNIFPTQGFFADLKVLAVFPFEDDKATMPFEVVSADVMAAVPFNDNISMVLNAFVGTNLSEVGLENKDIITKYGFTTYDRTFFPHIMQRYSYGIHKVALKADFQFHPAKSLTVLGGQIFVGLGGAVGNVWDDFASMKGFESLEWQASALSGLQITNSIGMILRVGAAQYPNEIVSFFSLDFKVKSY